MTRSIDFNCDMGEGMSTDAEIIPFITSANIACGYHAGNLETMKRTIETCLLYGVAVGAHPSYKDPENFGRTDLLGTQVRLSDIAYLITGQLYIIQDACEKIGAVLHHVKPHGALYNRAARDEEVAERICAAIAAFNPALVFYGLSGSLMKAAATQHGLNFAAEVFADRSYTDDGMLMPRSMAGSLIESESDCLAQVKQMVFDRTVTGMPSGNKIGVAVDTICIHGDGPHAVSFARQIHQFLKTSDIVLQAI